MKQKLLSILLWSVVSAAFIGPGTLATATSAGSGYGLSLGWALIFATFACLVLQEMVARISISTGKGLIDILKSYFANQAWAIVIGGSVILGCMAYQAGNILGAVSGLSITLNISHTILTGMVGLVCFIVLFSGSVGTISKGLGALVAIMGILFSFLAFQTVYNMPVINRPVDSDATVLVLGLVGTTIVPYNLFLGAGIAKGETLASMRFGLSISVILGGLISFAVLLVATNLNGQRGFMELANYMKSVLGNWAFYFMGIGLFAAGITSSLTSPLAASIIMRELLSKESAFRVTWMSILTFGLLFGLMDIKPIPVIIAAQALNIFVLPAIVYLIMLLVNDESVLSKEYMNSQFQNVLGIMITDVILVLALHGLCKTFGIFEINSASDVLVIQLAVLPILFILIFKISRLRSV